MNDLRHQAQPSLHSGGLGQSVPVPGRSDTGIHSGLVETLLTAAAREDKLISDLLLAFARNDRSGVEELAMEIACIRGRAAAYNVLMEAGFRISGDSPMPSQVAAYQDKLLKAIHREEILLDSLAAASAQGDRPTLFRLCRELTTNRKRFDPEFRRKPNLTKEPDL